MSRDIYVGMQILHMLGSNFSFIWKFLNQFHFFFPLPEIMKMPSRQRKMKLNWFKIFQTKEKFESQHCCGGTLYIIYQHINISTFIVSPLLGKVKFSGYIRLANLKVPFPVALMVHLSKGK